MPGVCAVSLFDLASQNLLSPMVLFFVLGLLAALTGTLLPLPPLTKVLPWLLPTTSTPLQKLNQYAFANYGESGGKMTLD